MVLTRNSYVIPVEKHFYLKWRLYKHKNVNHSQSFLVHKKGREICTTLGSDWTMTRWWTWLSSLWRTSSGTFSCTSSPSTPAPPLWQLNCPNLASLLRGQWSNDLCSSESLQVASVTWVVSVTRWISTRNCMIWWVASCHGVVWPWAQVQVACLGCRLHQGLYLCSRWSP